MVEQFESVDEYIASFPEAVRPVLAEVRRAIRDGAPDADESISYGMPAYKVDGVRVTYFAGWKKHVALYAIPPLPDELEREVAPYRAAKDTVRFPFPAAAAALAAPVPAALITRIIRALPEARAPH
jgi:uncharacterized protein YdhG (YjbR/CyaY superfamily)